MGLPVACVFDRISHGGYIATGSPEVLAQGRSVARLTDAVFCTRHGWKIIVTASETVTANGLGVARHGDWTSCGATILSESSVLIG